jgi:colanic acid/amylovoran biosynthesis protein
MPTCHAARDADTYTPPTFLVTGACLSRNLGSAAMAFATIDLLTKTFPHCRVSVLSTQSAKDRSLYPQQHIQHDSRTSVRGALLLCRAVLWRLALIVKDLRRLRAGEELEAYHQADLVLDLSGDTFTEDYGPLVLLSHCITILIAKCFRRPVVLLGQTVGPFSWSTRLMVQLLRSCDVIVARDEPTYRYLRKLGIAADRLAMSADMAFLLEPMAPEQAETIEAECGYQPSARLTLGMTVSQQYRQFVQKHPARSTDQDVLDVLACVVDRFVEAHDAQVILFAHVTGPPDRLDDRLVARQLRERCRRADRVLVVDRELDPRMIKTLISRADLFCGARMHSNIAATSSFVPTVALAYSVKSHGIMARMRMAEWVIEIGEFTEDEVLKRLDRLAAHADAVRRVLKETIPPLRRQAAGNADIIRRLLARTAGYPTGGRMHIPGGGYHKAHKTPPARPGGA